MLNCNQRATIKDAKLAWDLACQLQVIPTSNSKSLQTIRIPFTLLLKYCYLRLTTYESRHNYKPHTGA